MVINADPRKDALRFFDMAHDADGKVVDRQEVRQGDMRNGRLDFSTEFSVERGEKAREFRGYYRPVYDLTLESVVLAEIGN